MEVYTLDSLLRREHVVDRFESMIWTERFSEVGDFELVIHSTPENRKRFPTGTKIAINNSYRVMTVETVENTEDDDGKNVLKIKGRSLEAILEDRVARRVYGASVSSDISWNITGTPGNVARQLFSDICVHGYFNAGDKIPFIQTGNIFPPDNIQEPQYEIVHEQLPDTLFKAIKDLCDFYNLGFRLIRNFDRSELYFNVYTGSDRTSGQTLLAPVVFAPELDNLQKATAFKTTENSKNVAYVFSPTGSVIVYPDDVDPEVEGFERRALFLKVEDLSNKGSTDPDKPELTPEQIESALIQKGREELSKHRTFQAFDGEIDQNSNYKYGTHYNLGDLVEIRNSDGEANNMRVTEQIFVSDKEGERSYPTLTLNQYINPGSWLTWNFNQVWEDMGPTEYWSTV